MEAVTADRAPEPEAPPRRPGMAKFYVAGLALVALALGGAWFWTAWRVWWFDAAGAGRRQREAAGRLGVPVERTVDLPPSPSGSGAAGGDGLALKLVLIPAGWFQMGSPDEAGRSDDEGPLRRVRITRPFYMGRHEVTQEVWERVMGSNPSVFKGPKRPVEQVSWDDCQDFLKKLNALVKERGTFRLPTEAEWEWACRAGTRTRFCCGGGDAGLALHAWHDGNSGGGTQPVGEKRPNAWGLYDVHGNVWECCSDWYGAYGPRPGAFGWVTDPAGPASGSHRVLRGGSWDSYPGECRSAYRGYDTPATRGSNYGLRVLVVVPSPGPR